MPMDGVTHRGDHIPTPDGVRLATYTWLPENGSPRAIVGSPTALRNTPSATTASPAICAPTASPWSPRTTAATARPPPPRAASASGASRATPGAPSSPTCAPSATTAPREFPGAPLYPLGHGMGSMLARDCAQEYGGDLSGLIHSGTFRSPPATDPDADHHSPRGRDPRGRPHRPVRLRPQLFASFNDPLDPAPATNGSRATRRGGRLRGGRAMRLRLQRGPVPRRGPRRPQDQRPPNQARTPTRLPVHIAVGTKDPCNQADGAGPRAHRGLSLPRPP